MLLSLAVVGCATTKTPVSSGPPSPCAKDLMDQGYVSGRSSKASAEAYCTQYSAGEIAIAKDLHDRKYEPRFAEGLSTAHQYTPAQIACAKKERDSWSGGTASHFQVPESCVDATFHDSSTTISATRGLSTTTAAAKSESAETTEAAPAATKSAPPATSGSLSATAAADAKTNSLYDVLSADKRFSKFVSLVDFVGLGKSLKPGGGPWTVMAPTNAAIARYPGGYEALKAKPDKLKTIMTLHLVDAVRPSSDLKLPDKKGVTGKRWPTAQGRHLTMTEKGGRIFINDDIKVTKADIHADNGLIYVIDTVITP